MMAPRTWPVDRTSVIGTSLGVLLSLPLLLLMLLELKRRHTMSERLSSASFSSSVFDDDELEEDEDEELELEDDEELEEDATDGGWKDHLATKLSPAMKTVPAKLPKPFARECSGSGCPLKPGSHDQLKSW